MENQQLQWLRDDIESVKEDVKQINSKVDEMLQFKWQIVGGSVVISAVLAVAVQLILQILNK